MNVTLSNQLRICSSCAGDINKGDTYSHDPDGDVVCADCTPEDIEGDYEDDCEEWADYSDDLAYEDSW